MSDVYKLECIDVQHAIIATLRIKTGGGKAIRLGRAVLTDAAMARSVPSVLLDAMARTTEPTDNDMKIWSESHDE